MLETHKCWKHTNVANTHILETHNVRKHTMSENHTNVGNTQMLETHNAMSEKKHWWKHTNSTKYKISGCQSGIQGILFFMIPDTFYMYWCTLDRTFHRANPTTLKHFVRQFFFFLIVSNGGWNDESYKKIEYLFIFVPYLSVLKVREWIYVDVDRPRFPEKKLVWQLHRPPGANFDWFRNFAGTMSMSRSLENWETIQKLHQVVCGSGCIIFFLKSRPIYVNVDSLYVNVDSLSHL